MQPKPSFFGSLFDFSFSHFVTLRLIKFLYALAITVIVFVVLGVIAAGFTQAVSGVETLSYLVLAPILGFVYLLLTRVWLELIVVIFRIGETAGEIRDELITRGSEPPREGERSV